MMSRVYAWEGGKGQEGRGLIARGWSVWRDRPWELGYLNSYKYIQWLKNEIEIAQVIQGWSYYQ